MHRRQAEQQRERVRCQNEQRDDAEPEQRDCVAGEPFLEPGRAARHEVSSPGQPGDRDQRAGGQQREHGPVVRRRRGRVRRPRRSAGPRSEQLEDVEDDADEEPERESPAQAAARRAERDAAAAAVREQVDDPDQERHEQGKQQHLDRPAAHGAVADPDEARRAARQVEALVERADERLRAAAELRHACGVETCRAVGEGIRRPLASRRHRDRGYPACHERPLLVQREREAEVDQLAQHAGPAGRRPSLLGDAPGGRRGEHGGGRARRVAGDDDARRLLPTDRGQVHDGRDVERQV